MKIHPSSSERSSFDQLIHSSLYYVAHYQSFTIWPLFYSLNSFGMTIGEISSLKVKNLNLNCIQVGSLIPSTKFTGVLNTTNLNEIRLAMCSSLNSFSSEGNSESSFYSVSFSRMPLPTPILIKLILSIGVRSFEWMY